LKKGKVEGVEIGEKKSFRKGEESGLEKGEKNKTIEIAKAMKKDKKSVEEIQKYTQLTEVEIQKL